MQSGTSGFPLLASGLQRILLTLTQKPCKEVKQGEEKIRIEEKAITPIIAQMQIQRQSSKHLNLLKLIVKILALREPLISVSTLHALEIRLNVPTLDCLDSEEMTPLMHGAAIGSIGYVQALLKNQANPNLKDKKGRNVLNIAVTRVGNPVIPFLLATNVDINHMSEGFTPLMRAAENNDALTVHLLVDRQARVDLTNDSGMDALMVAARGGFVEVAKILLKAGAPVDAKDAKNKRDALEWLFLQKRALGTVSYSTSSEFLSSQYATQVKALDARVKLAALLLSYHLQIVQPKRFHDFLAQIESNLHPSTQTAWAFCMAETLRQIDKTEDKAVMLSHYQQACDGKPMIPAAAYRLSNFALQKNDYLEAASYLIQAITGEQHIGLHKQLQQLCQLETPTTGNPTVSDYKQTVEPTEISADEFEADPFSWQQLIKLTYQLENLQATESPEEKSKSLEGTPEQQSGNPSLQTETKLQTEPVPTPEQKNTTAPAKEETKSQPELLTTFSSFEKVRGIIIVLHNLLLQISLPILPLLKELTPEEWEYLLIIIQSNADKLNVHQQCGRLVMTAALRCYESIPLSPKDKLAKVLNAWKQLEKLFPSLESPPEPESKSQKGDEKSTLPSLKSQLGLDEDESFESLSTTDSLVTRKSKDNLLASALKLCLNLSSEAEQKKLFGRIRKPGIQLHSERPGDAKTEETEISFESFPMNMREEMLLEAFSLLPQRKKANLLKETLSDIFRILSQADDSQEKFSLQQATKHWNDLPLTKKEQFLLLAKQRYIPFYKAMLADCEVNEEEKTAILGLTASKLEDPIKDCLENMLKEIEANLDPVQVSKDCLDDILKEIEVRSSFSKESPELIRFAQLIDPLLPVIKSEEKPSDPEDLAEDISQQLIDTGFPADVLNTLLFELVKTTFVAKEETPAEQEQVISQLILNISFDQRRLPVLQNCEAIFSPEQLRGLQAELVNIPIVDCLDKSGQTPLMYAAAAGAIGFVRVLLRGKANVNLKDFKGRTPLSHAICTPTNPAVRLLLEAGSDPNIVDDEGRSPLIIATLNEDFAAVELLLSSKALIDVPDKTGNTALNYAALRGFQTLVQFFLEHEAKVDSPSSNGDTALIFAARNGYFNIVKLLIQHKAVVNLANTEGSTALREAAKNGYFLVGQTLFAAGAHIRVQNCNLFEILFLSKNVTHQVVSYADPSFNPAEFIQGCNTLSNRLQLAALFLSQNQTIESPKRFQDLLLAIEKHAPAIVSSSEGAWNFCMGEALRLENPQATPASVQEKMQGYYEQCTLKFSPSIRRLGELSTNRGEYKEAASLLIRARMSADFLAWKSLIKLGSQLCEVDSAGAKSARAQIEPYFLELNLEQLYLLSPLSGKEWGYLALIFHTAFNTIQDTSKENAAVLILYAAHQCYQLHPRTPKDEIHNFLESLEEAELTPIMAPSSGDSKSSDPTPNYLSLGGESHNVDHSPKETKDSLPQSEELLQKNLGMFLEFATSEEQETLWSHLKTLPTSKESKESKWPDKKKEILNSFGVLPTTQKIKFIKRLLIAGFVVRWLIMDPEFRNSRRQDIFKSILEHPLIPSITQNLREIFNTLPISEKEKYFSTVKSYIQNFQRTLKLQDLTTAHPDLHIFVASIQNSLTLEEKSSQNVSRASSLTTEDYIFELIPTLFSNPTHFRDAEDNSLVIRAIKAKRDQRLKLLLESKTDVNLTNSLAENPLYLAVKTGNFLQTKQLLKAKANPNLYTTQKLTSPLIIAASHGYLTFIEYLVNYKADVNMLDHFQATALDYAVQNKDLPCVQFLLQSGANTNPSKDSSNISSLLRAAQVRNKKIARILLEEKADVHSKTKEGWGALHWIFATTQVDMASSDPKKKKLSYNSAEYKVDILLQECKDLTPTLECTALFLSHNLSIPSFDKFRSLMQNLEKQVPSAARGYWAFCMGEILYQAIMKTKKPEEKAVVERNRYYEQAERIPELCPIIARRRGEFTAKTAEAAKYFLQAFSDGDLFSVPHLVRLSFKISTELAQPISDWNLIKRLVGKADEEKLFQDLIKVLGTITSSQLSHLSTLGPAECHFFAELMINHAESKGKENENENALEYARRVLFVDKQSGLASSKHSSRLLFFSQQISKFKTTQESVCSFVQEEKPSIIAKHVAEYCHGTELSAQELEKFPTLRSS